MADGLGNVGGLLGTVLVAGVALKMADSLFQPRERYYRRERHYYRKHKKKLSKVI
jgi:hypothetical protein